jgi:prophage antirepressor-like protein
MAAVVQMTRDETQAAADEDRQTSLRNVREMTTIAEHEIHAIVFSCARARRLVLAVLPATKPTLH